MTTVTEGVTLTRDRLNEITASHWSDNQLKRWLNEGCNDLTRRSLCDMDRFTIVASSGVNEYTLSAATTLTNVLSAVSGITAAMVLRIDRLEYLPGSDDRVIELTPVDYDSMSALWGSYQNSSTGTPSVFTTWGNPPFLAIKVYPAPDQTSSLRVFCRRLARTILTTDTTQVIDVPSGWEDIVFDYATYRAIQNDRDPLWQQFFQIYESRVQDAIDSINDYTRAQAGIVPEGIYGAPAWLVYDDGRW